MAVKPLAILNLGATSRPVRAAKYFSNKEKVVAVCDCLQVGTMANSTTQQIVDSILCNHHDRHAARVCRTAIISVKTPPDVTPGQRTELATRIVQAFTDLYTELGVSGVAWIHGNTRTIHGHGLFPNSDGRRTLDLSPTLLRKLQAFEWTEVLASGRGKGSRRALPVYPKAEHLDVRDLASALVTPEGAIRDDVWDLLIAKGLINNIRQRRDGSKISFEFSSRRIRFGTLKGFVFNEQQKTKKLVMPAHQIEIHKPVAAEVLKDFEAVGISASQIKAIHEEFREARRIRQLNISNVQQQPTPQIK